MNKRCRHMIRWLVALAFVLAAPPARAQQPLLADLSGHLIAITTGFTGTSVVLFGATDGPGDIVTIVRGPERDAVVWQKHHLAGLWINGHSVTFANVPSYYAVFSNRALADIAPPNAQAASQIGIANLRIDPRDPRTKPGETTTFRAALVDERKRAHLFAEYPGSVAFLGDRLFRATLDFPAQCSDRKLSRRSAADPKRQSGRGANDAAGDRRNRDRRRCQRIRGEQCGALRPCRRHGRRAAGLAREPAVPPRLSNTRGSAR